ncbi:hypothetical protein [Pseudonocardia alni]|uniref:Uncharacterized protein n=1 Tax=Pseudonocardia alni TaxID=33907 RepID=A0AA44ZMD2_PSEA5|nr:hypothetical protein [Pseudonocardia alni]OJG07944.1 hypothetical protein BG618_00489 [Pseudonocardia autotrophica]PKB28748.1 hypothetical protein ATL51_0370 [Pseudonocardia alni]
MSPQPLRSDVRRSWRADDTDLARLLWQQIDRLQPLRGRKCSAHRPENAAYFVRHRENVFVSA